MWLTKKDLPTKIEIESNSYSIHSDFRSWINFECIMLDTGIQNQFKPYFMIDAVLNESLKTGEEEQVLNALFSFYRMGKPFKKTVKQSNEIAYQFDYDMDLIIAAFQQQYNVSLLTADMHWWEFKSLFNGLTDKTKFIQVIGYRTTDTSKMDKEQKRRYQELKEFYSIPSTTNINGKAQEDIEADLLKRLGGEEDG